MNGSIAKSASAVAPRGEPAIPARRYNAAPVRLPAGDSFPAAAPALVGAADAHNFMERDISAQVSWLTRQAMLHGYTDLQRLLVGAPQLYTRLAEVWRRRHPFPLAA
jgi:hypothetical protein